MDCRYLYLIIVLLLLYYLFPNYYKNYSKTFSSNGNNKKIAIVMIVSEGTEIKYKHAINTVSCYCSENDCEFLILDENLYPPILKQCEQQDFMFRRHCVVAMFGQECEATYNYIIFIEGDIGVINPKHDIKNFLPKGREEILFYNKFFNNDIMAGSYIFKNTQYARNFLYYFANYEKKVPIQHDESDGIAIHAAFVDYLRKGGHRKEYEHCIKLWRLAEGNHGNLMFTTCMRWILNKYNEKKDDKDEALFDNGRLVILSKSSKRRWARDGWLTDWKFCENDFFHHGWTSEIVEKESLPFVKAGVCYEYDSSVKIDCSKIDDDLGQFIKNTEENEKQDLELSGLLRI
uniref:Nucleotide-diphospho-sugar transferase domain-containing protein n=1 Tax=Parastrongyloides trichosuri TaxID=131310 RepID=A0A0N5A713_PARTI